MHPPDFRKALTGDVIYLDRSRKQRASALSPSVARLRGPLRLPLTEPTAMSLTTPHDIPLQITVPADSPSSPPLVSSERRITPTWTIEQLKTKLEPITGIPSSCQSLRTCAVDGNYVYLSDDNSLVGDARYGLRKGTEIEVSDDH